jgi:hypothetical protein
MTRVWRDKRDDVIREPKAGQLHEFVAQEEARGIGRAKRREVEAAAGDYSDATGRWNIAFVIWRWFELRCLIFKQPVYILPERPSPRPLALL